MKRNYDVVDMKVEDMITDSENQICITKKVRSDDGFLLMDSSDDVGSSDQTVNQLFNRIAGPNQCNLVEREPNPLGIQLVNPEYSGKKSYQELVELEANASNASQFLAANMGNRVDQIGRQMKYLHESLQKALMDTKRDSELHMAACNFAKKPGQTYHLYEKPSGQKYFSMLSPNDWQGNAPHAFMGSWYLESDQSWTPAEERLTRYEGVGFLKNWISQKMLQ